MADCKEITVKNRKFATFYKSRINTTGILATILGVLLTAFIAYFISLGDRLVKVESNLLVVQSSIEIMNQSNIKTDNKIDKLDTKIDKLTDYLIEKSSSK
jgi:hypothetical protein